MQPKLPEDSGWMGDRRRGASLGRVDVSPETLPPGLKFNLRRVHVNYGGYDEGGSYWGCGLPLYWAAADTGELGGEVSWFFRAYDREEAKEQVRAKHPGARFYI